MPELCPWILSLFIFQLRFLPCCIGTFSSLGSGTIESVPAERGSLSPSCSNNRHWSSLGSMLVPDPSTGMQGSDWPGLEHVPTQVMGERAGPCSSQVLRDLGKGHPKRKVEGCYREVGVGSRQTQAWTSTTLTPEMAAHTDPRMHFSHVMRSLEPICPWHIISA